MSPKVRRRQSVMLGSRTPVNASRKRRIEVWSNGSLHTQPPAVHGEITMHGTRKPPPIGRPPTNSPGVPVGGTGGGTCSNSPSFPVLTSMNQVLAPPFGLAAIPIRLIANTPATAAGGLLVGTQHF